MRTVELAKREQTSRSRTHISGWLDELCLYFLRKMTPYSRQITSIFPENTFRSVISYVFIGNFHPLCSTGKVQRANGTSTFPICRNFLVMRQKASNWRRSWRKQTLQMQQQHIWICINVCPIKHVHILCSHGRVVLLVLRQQYPEEPH